MHGGAQITVGGHASLTSYVSGFLLAAALTLLAFLIVASGSLTGAALAAVIGILAAAQIAVHLVLFLHMSRAPALRWHTFAMLFTLVVVAILISGSIWIIYHLQTNMMPMAPGA